MTSPRFGSVLTAMATPFDAEGQLDVDGAVALARWLVDNGNEGLVVTGTTGESPVLSDDEKQILWRAVVEAVDVPVIAGAGTNDTEHSVALTRAAQAAGAAAILAVTPYYNRPSQAGLAGHFRAIAAATTLPVVLYDIPVRSGRKIAHATILELLRSTANIIAVKDAAGNPGASAALVAEAPDGFELYSGDDNLTLPLLAIGAVGTIGVATHWAGRLTQEMVAAFRKGDVEHARALNARLLPSYAYESSDEAPNPVPTKAMLEVLGLPGGTCRPPMGPAPAGLDDRARQLLAALGADGPAPVRG